VHVTLEPPFHFTIVVILVPSPARWLLPESVNGSVTTRSANIQMKLNQSVSETDPDVDVEAEADHLPNILSSGGSHCSDGDDFVLDCSCFALDRHLNQSTSPDPVMLRESENAPIATSSRALGASGTAHHPSTIVGG
jgi:hypothetical protein